MSRLRMKRPVLRNMGRTVMAFARKYGDEAGNDLLQLYGKFRRHSCDYARCRKWQAPPPLLKEVKREIHDLAADIATCSVCQKKVNYCCHLHQTAVEAFQKGQ